MVLRKQRIRLYGINAPEVRGPQRIAGLESKAWLLEKVLDQKIEFVSIKHRKGRYGRWLGIIYFQNESINDLMLENGLAVPAHY